MMIEETESVHRYLPMHYNCEPLSNGIRCTSPIGMEQDIWDHFNKMLGEMFGSRLVRVNDLGINQTHNNFIIFLKKK